MKEHMTQKHYDLLVSAGLLNKHPKRPYNDCTSCLATTPDGKTGVAINSEGMLCIVYPVSRTNYEYVYTNYERRIV